MVGRTILHYEILEELGRGAMGTVYKARDTRLDVLRTLKFLRPGLTDEEPARRRLLQEARTQARLIHPNVSALMALEVADDGAFLVLQYVEGTSLDRYLERMDPDPVTRFSLIRQVAAALEAAHGLGIIHRDIKPSNILVGADGIVRVTDFGLAKALGSANVSLSGEVKGTAAYLPPEAFRGEPVDRRADVWALGVLTWEVLEGRRLFEPGNWEVIGFRIMNDPVPPLTHSLQQRLPGIDGFLEDCLVKDPARRLPDGQVVSRRLAEITRAAGIGDTYAGPLPVGWVSNGLRSLKRRTLQLAAGLVLLAGIGIGLRLSRNGPVQSSHYWPLTTANYSLSWNAGGSRLAYVPDDSRDEFAVRDLDDPAGSVRFHVVPGAGQISEVSWSPDDSLIVVRANNGTFLYETYSGRSERVSATAFEGLSWHPHERELVFRRRRGEAVATVLLGHLRLVRGPGGVAAWSAVEDSLSLSGVPTGQIYYPVFTHNGSRLAFVLDDGGRHKGIWSVPSTGGVATEVSGGDPQELIALKPWNLDWDQERSELFFCRRESSGLYALPLDPQGRALGHPRSLRITGLVSDFDFASRNGRLASFNSGQNYYLVGFPLTARSDGDTLRKIFETATDPRVDQLFTPSWSMDSHDVIFSALTVSGLELYRLDPRSGSIYDLLQSRGEFEQEWQPAVNPVIPQRIAFVGGRGETQVLVVADGGRTWILSEPGESVGMPSWSGDGRSIYYTRIIGERETGRTCIARLELDPTVSRPQVLRREIVVEGPGRRLRSPLADPYGRSLLYMAGEDSIWVRDLATSADRFLAFGTYPTLIPPGTDLLFLQGETILRIKEWPRAASQGVTISPMNTLTAGLQVIPPSAMTASREEVYLTVSEFLFGGLSVYTLRR
jgi:serine/threonine protein kinase